MSATTVDKVMKDLNTIKKSKKKVVVEKPVVSLTWKAKGLQFFTPVGYRTLRKGEQVQVGDTYAYGIGEGKTPTYLIVKAGAYPVGYKARGFGIVSNALQVYRKLEEVKPPANKKATKVAAKVTPMVAKDKTEESKVNIAKVFSSLHEHVVPFHIDGKLANVPVSGDVATLLIKAVAQHLGNVLK
jgi:hypothetical protein